MIASFGKDLKVDGSFIHVVKIQIDLTLKRSAA
jgi:hypothetical protein